MKLTRITNRELVGRFEHPLRAGSLGLMTRNLHYNGDRVTESLPFAWIFVKTKKSYRGYYRLHKVTGLIPFF